MKLYIGLFQNEEFYFIMNYTDVVAFDGHVCRINTVQDLVKMVNNYTTIEYIDNYFFKQLLSEPGTYIMKEFDTIDELRNLKQTDPEWFV